MGFRIRNTSLQYTARPVLHCTALTTLHHHYSTARPLLHSTVLTTLHHHHSTALCRTQYTAPLLLHCTVLTTMHCTHFTACSDPHLIKEPKIFWIDINERFFLIILSLNNLELMYNVQIWICSYLNIHDLQKQTNFQNAQNLIWFIISFLEQ